MQDNQSQTPVYHNDEIDLVDLIVTLWEGKWTIVAIVLIALLGTVGFLWVTPQSFTATTEIKPISSQEAEAYSLFNSVEVFEITPSLLLDTYIEEVRYRTIFEEAILDLALLDRGRLFR